MTRDVVVVMVSDTFSDSRRRGFYSTADQTILSLLQSDRIGKVLVVDHPRGVLSQVKRRVAGDSPAPVSGRLRGTRPLSLRTATPVAWPAILRRYRAYDQQVRMAACRYGLHEVAVVNFNLFHAAVGSPWASREIFYAQDDETALPHRVPWRMASERAYRQLAARTTVVGVTPTLLHRIQGGRHSPGLVIPNGIDPQLWTHLPARAPRAVGSAPVAVYAGTVDTRLDLSAFGALAAGGYQVRLVGPVTDAITERRVRAIGGVTLTGKVGRDAVVQELVGADVCVLAHLETRLTQAMSPLKLFEYVVSGTPVVSTDLGSTPVELEGFVTLVRPGGDYLEAAQRARQLDRLDPRRRMEVLARVSWRERHRLLIDLIDDPTR